MTPTKHLREIVLARIEQAVRRAIDDDPGDVVDELDLKSDEELLAWYDRINQLSSRTFRLDGPGW